MNYTEIVDVIKKITGVNVPVAYNQQQVSCACFGIPEDTMFKILPDYAFENPMFDAIDFLTNEHLPYFQISLCPSIPLKCKSFIYEVLEKQLKKNGIFVELDNYLLEVFIILHEFGHAHQLLQYYNGDVMEYISKTNEETIRNTNKCRYEGWAGTKVGFQYHKASNCEKYADTFAIKYFKATINEIDNLQMVG